MTWNQFNKRIHQAPDHVQQAWEKIHRQPRILFDSLCAEWRWTSVEQKVVLLRLLHRADLLDTLLRAYLTHYRDENRHVLGGLGFAVLEYAQAGYILRLPSHPFAQPAEHPFCIASLARALEDHQIDCSQYWWTVHELRRVCRAAEQWLEVHEGGV